ncbi:MAG: ABC transporter permease [Propionibacteriaceae bacterium]|jgi:ABC-type transport system involved in multi-copper enzyme maturation permease subunit|nr:ABC transporter permease [Propionibacteriaceae bacterium]
MTATLAMEFRKCFSTRAWWALLLITVVWPGFNVAIMVLSLHFGGAEVSTDAPGLIGLGGDELARLLYSMGTTFGYVLPAIAGALSVAGEYRHQTITPTLLADPARWRVLTAKFISVAPLAALYGLAVVVACLVFGAGLLALLGDPTGLGDRQTWELFARMIPAMTLWGLIGVGLGTLLGNQAVAIVVLLGITMFIEPTVRLLPLLVGHDIAALAYLPGALGDSVTGASLFSAFTPSDAAGSGLLPFLPAVGALLAYAVVLTVIGYVVRFRRDIG